MTQFSEFRVLRENGDPGDEFSSSALGVNLGISYCSKRKSTNQPNKPNFRLVFKLAIFTLLRLVKIRANWSLTPITGRYLNHSCSPNLDTQNVIVNTADLRFPTVAFFAKRNIQGKKRVLKHLRIQLFT